MHRHALTDAHWARIQPFLPRRASGRQSERGDRLFVDAPWRPLHVTLTAGERHEMVAARELLDFATGKAFIADTGYDSNDFRAEIRSRGLKPVIHSKPERRRALPLDRQLYRTRYLV